MPASTKKVLLAGDVDGNLSALFKRAAAVNKANGPFDLLLCTGAFFAPEGATDNTGQAGDDVLEYITGVKPVPLETYFIGASGAGAQRALETLELAQGTAATGPRVHYLGRSGLVNLSGLSVAFLDGTASSQASGSGQDGPSLTCQTYSQEDVSHLTTMLQRATADVDILLTREWPAGVTLGVPAGSVPAGCSTSGSETVADLAAKVRPRYHVAGTHGFYYDRPPYANKDLGAGSHVTRFIALASVGNPSKQRFLHALGLVPAADMDTAALAAKPPNTTPSPYEQASATRKRQHEALTADSGSEQSWRWQQNKRHQGMGRPDIVKDEACSVYAGNLPWKASEADLVAFFSPAGRVVDVRRRVDENGKLQGFGFIQFDSQEAAQRACTLSGQILQGREINVRRSQERPATQVQDGKPVEGCWFCLSNPNADVHLIVSIGEECYLVCDKGPINPTHVLVLPVEHQASCAAVPASAYAEIERYLSALRSAFASQGKDVFAFERFMQFRRAGGNHCQLNVLAIPKTSATSAAATLQGMAGKHGFSLQPISGPTTGQGAQEALQAAVGDQEYFCAILPDGKRMVHCISRGEKHPLSFGRDVAAALAKAPDRSDWKVCQEGKETEEERTNAFKELFKSYDVMNA